jgi:1,4-dihydroxy-2-naphthoate octaprenyltransferase
MATATAVVFAAAFVCGLSLVVWGGWVLLPVGVASLLFGWAYTSGPFPLAYHGLGDVFVFVFFGMVAVGGTAYVMTGALEGATLLAAVPVGLLATNILVVNNYRDRETDLRANKRTLVVRWGRSFAVAQYAVSFVFALIVPLAMAGMARSWPLALPVVLAPFALQLTRQLARGGDGATLNALLAATAKFLLAFGIVWAAVLVVA